jgi:hypothetical protein
MKLDLENNAMRPWILTMGALMAGIAIGLMGNATVNAQADRAPQPPKTTPVFLSEDLLKDKCVSAVAACRGWGRWETPFVLANTGSETAGFLNGAISIPPRSVGVHPGADGDVAVGWQSPIAGKVNVRAKVAHDHPGAGDGVTWAVIHESQAGQKVLVAGVSGSNSRCRASPHPHYCAGSSRSQTLPAC